MRIVCCRSVGIHCRLTQWYVFLFFGSWDEMARFDLPAMLKFVTTKTSQASVYYIGHSQGTTIAFAEFSRNGEVAKMVKKYFALAPVAHVGNIESPIKYLTDFMPFAQVSIIINFHLT